MFPFFTDQTEENQSLELYRDIAWDYEKNSPIVQNGEFLIVEGNEAIKAWCFRALQVRRYSNGLYSWSYGSELDSLIGKNYSKQLIQSEAERLIKECLLTNPYITEIMISSIEFTETTLDIKCEIKTIYGEVVIDVPRENT